jgi:hypothetical protein
MKKKEILLDLGEIETALHFLENDRYRLAKQAKETNKYLKETVDTIEIYKDMQESWNMKLKPTIKKVKPSATPEIFVKKFYKKRGKLMSKLAHA